MSKLVKCEICGHVYLPDAHHFHCPCCGSFPVMIGNRKLHFDISNKRQIAKPFSLTRSLAETINKLMQ